MSNLVGILSGSGPEAGLNICDSIHVSLQKDHGAIQDTDYPQYVLYNRPLKGFTESGVEDENVVIDEFVDAVRSLNNMGVSHIAIACNTLHLFISKLDKNIQKKILNIVSETVNLVIQNKKKRVLILSSNTTRNSRLYQSYFLHKSNIDVFSIDDLEQKKIDAIIKRVMGGLSSSVDSNYLNNLILSYIDLHNVDCFVLGCTELPIALKENKTGIKYFNPNNILVQKIISLSKL